MATDRLGSIIAFVRVAELGSFAAAGKALGLSASATSKSVARLEDRIGLRLLQRTTRSLNLTEEGQVFLDQCRRILDALDDAEREMRNRAGAPAGKLKVELPTALGRLKIAPALGRLTGRYPDLRVEASFGDQLTDLIEAGLDAVVRIGEPSDTRLMVKRVGTVRYIVCGAPAYLRAHGAPQAPDDLVNFECIQRLPLGSAHPACWRFADPATGDIFEREVTGTLSFNSNDVILDAGLNGSGLVQLHTYMTERYLASGELVQVLANYAAPGPPISVLFPSSRNLAPKVRAFVDFVTEIMHEGLPVAPLLTPRPRAAAGTP
jgi:LysR family transcriptional regulator, regulator for bpeEF and oprC